MSKKLVILLLAVLFVLTSALGLGCQKNGSSESSASESQSEIQGESQSENLESESQSEIQSESESQSEEQSESDSTPVTPEYAFDALVDYSVIAHTPLSVEPQEMVDDTATSNSTESNKYVLTWDNYELVNLDLEPYASLVFFMRSVDESSWISLKKADGTSLYDNNSGEKNADGNALPDTVWHKFEIRRESSNGDAIYQIYVDDKKLTTFGLDEEEVSIDATLNSKLTDVYFVLQGEYYLSELFATANEDYVVPSYEIIQTNPFEREPDDLTTEDYPCEESYELNVHQIPKWGKYSLRDVKLAPYSKVKFYIKGGGSWISFKKAIDEGEILYMDNKNTHILTDGTWNEILLEKTEEGYSFFINGKQVNFTFKYNLNEIKLTLNEDSLIVSELLAVKDSSYVEVLPSVLDVSPLAFKTATMSEVITDLAPNACATKSYVYEVSSWCKSFFEERNLLAYEEVVFYVKSTTGDWVTVSVDGVNVLACQDIAEWHEIKFAKSLNGFMAVTVDGSLKSISVSNLAQVSMSLTGGDTVYVSELYAIEDSQYQSADVTFTSGVGYEYKVDYVYLKEGVATVGVGATVTFKVELGGLYNKSEITVSANGKTVTPTDGVYSVSVEGDVEITVSGVVENPLEDKDYVEVARNPFGLTGVEDTVDLGSGYCAVTTISSTKWGKGYTFVAIDANMYTELRFFVKSTTWFELYSKDESKTYWANKAPTWMDVKLVKGQDSWMVYVNDEERGTIVLTNLKDDFKVELGDATIYLSELLGEKDPNYVPSEDEGGEVCVADVIADFGGEASDNVNTVDGYSKSTQVNGSNSTYAGLQLADVDLSQYTEIRFSIRCDGTHWVEIGLVESGDFKGLSFNNDEWIEIKFINEGNGKFQAYKDGKWVNFSLSLDANLSDLQIRLASSGTFYLSEVLCK